VEKKITFNESDFKIDWFSGTGKGGQHRNKHQNCCRVTHIETGIKANGTENRSRESNKRAAISVCKSRVYAYFHRDEERFKATDERVRTYHAEDNRVVDHASGVINTYKKVVIKGDLSEMIESRLIAKNKNDTRE
jgi:protein subunit release factor A